MANPSFVPWALGKFGTGWFFTRDQVKEHLEESGFNLKYEDWPEIKHKLDCEFFEHEIVDAILCIPGNVPSMTKGVIMLS